MESVRAAYHLQQQKLFKVTQPLNLMSDYFDLQQQKLFKVTQHQQRSQTLLNLQQQKLFKVTQQMQAYCWDLIYNSRNYLKLLNSPMFILTKPNLQQQKLFKVTQQYLKENCNFDLQQQKLFKVTQPYIKGIYKRISTIVEII